MKQINLYKTISKLMLEISVFLWSMTGGNVSALLDI